MGRSWAKLGRAPTPEELAALRAKKARRGSRKRAGTSGRPDAGAEGAADRGDAKATKRKASRSGGSALATGEGEASANRTARKKAKNASKQAAKVPVGAGGVVLGTDPACVEATASVGSTQDVTVGAEVSSNAVPDSAPIPAAKAKPSWAIGAKQISGYFPRAKMLKTEGVSRPTVCVGRTQSICSRLPP